MNRNKEKAQEYIDRALTPGPNNANALFSACFIYKELKNYDKCSRYMESMLKLDSTNLTMWNDLGIAYNELAKHAKALSCYTHTLKMLPENAGTYYNLAATYSLMHQKKDALRYLAKAVTCSAIVKRFPGRDSNFLWLRGNIELCNIIYSDSIPNYVINLR